MFACASLSLCARLACTTFPSLVAPLSHDTDTADLYSHFTPACHFIHTALSAGHAALIHCQQGISRSAALATAYLIRHHSLTLRDAYIRVKHSRPTVKVNANFLKQLISWEKNCSSSSSNTHTQQRQHAAQQQQADTQQHRGNTTEKEAAVGRQRRRKRSEEAQEEPGADDEKKDVAGTEQKETEESVLTAAAARTDGDGERAGAAGSDGVGSSKRQRVMDVAVQPSQLPPIRVVQQTAVDGAAAKS